MLYYYFWEVRIKCLQVELNFIDNNRKPYMRVQAKSEIKRII